MRRRDFLARAAKATAAAVLSPVLRGWAQDASTVAASLTVRPENDVLLIPADFTGLSYESAQLAYPPFFSAENTALVAFCRTLGKQGVLRIGGNTSEFTHWTEQETAAPVPTAAGPDTGASKTKPVTPITPSAIRNLAGFLDATGWKLIYGLNLGRGKPRQAATEAKFVQNIMGPRLIAFQIGNEPDLYGHNGLRPPTWNFDAYLAEWVQFARAIRHQVHHARFAAPDVASNISWVVDFAEHASQTVIFLTYHYYAEGPPIKPEMNLDRLLHPNPDFESKLAQIQQASRSSKRPVRLSETNSCYNGGKEGVSDTFASALWGADLMFHVADAGQSGINFHGGGNGIYTPIAGSLDAGFLARPIYYGMLFFKQALGATLVQSAFDAGGANATAYAVRLPDDTFGVAIINKDRTKALRLNVNPVVPVHRAELLRLAAPAIDSKSGVTFGGAEVSPSGGWSPSQTEAPDHTDSAVTIELPAASAAWLRIA
ncbi:MAG: glycosyl hydrolase family 79 C-terminal domain-containing protein [Candidatus Acidiferrales bacterium]